MIGAPIGTAIGGAPYIQVHTAEELRAALRQADKPIVIDDPELAQKAEFIFKLRQTAIIGGLLAAVA